MKPLNGIRRVYWLFDHDDILTENALFEVVDALQTPNIEMVYSDEDKIVDRTGYLKDPHFKPDLIST